MVHNVEATHVYVIAAYIFMSHSLLARQAICCLLLLSCVFGPSRAQAEASLKVRYTNDNPREIRSSFAYALLGLILEKSGRKFDLQVSELAMSEERARNLISAQSEIVNVIWTGTGKRFESMLRPVRLPIFGGLLGYRLFLIEKRSQAGFSDVRVLDDLRHFLAAQGSNWADVEVLEGAGLKVYEADYLKLLKLLEARRLHYFPRSVTEIFLEYQRWSPEYPGLAIEKDLVLHYPFAAFFFVARENEALHDAIYEGFAAAHEDGSYLALFQSHPETYEALRQARLTERRLISIPNPTLTQETLDIPRQYWFNPQWLPRDAGAAGLSTAPEPHPRP